MTPDTDFNPRPAQLESLSYTAGLMGVSAVPGSGKTWTLSRLAAQIIASGELADDQEVLVVTLVNSAVDNFYQRVGYFVRQMGLLPNMGYRVRTLHGLAHDIVRQRPDLVGLAEDFQIIDERESSFIREEAAQAWLHSHPYHLDGYLNPELDENKRSWVVRDHLPELVNDIALAVIRYAKDNQYGPERLRQRLDKIPLPLPLAEMGADIYADYQRGLIYRGAVDFDDLVRLALDALHLDPTLLEQLRYRWPYILEDEAQDSSRLQEEILHLLAGSNRGLPGGNWVRVGDPNQAIYETFTTADPKYLRQFIARSDVVSRELPNSGRSTQSIIDLANYLVDWTQSEHPIPAVRTALVAPPHIQPTPPGDPQPNPQDNPQGIYLISRKYTPQEEILAVADSLERWLPEHTDQTVAVLAPRNQRCIELVDELSRRKIETIDSLLRSTSATRHTSGALGNLLRYLGDPGSPTRLATAFRVWARSDSNETAEKKQVERLSELLRKCGQVEDYLWPGSGEDWLEQTGLAETDPEGYEQLLAFRRDIRRWQAAAPLPVDQLTLTLAQDIFEQPAELALSHKLAVLLRRAGDAHGSWRLPELTEELAVIARNERRFLGFSEDDTGFDPNRYPGKVLVA
ncbi:MAG: UvrD-helicase domain-containing protein, partial [Anaerolineales bacterium]